MTPIKSIRSSACKIYCSPPHALAHKRFSTNLLVAIPSFSISNIYSLTTLFFTNFNIPSPAISIETGVLFLKCSGSLSCVIVTEV